MATELLFEMVPAPTGRHSHAIEADGTMRVYKPMGDVKRAVCGIVEAPWDCQDAHRKGIQQLIRIAQNHGCKRITYALNASHFAPAHVFREEVGA